MKKERSNINIPNSNPVLKDETLVHNSKGYSVVYDPTTGKPKETKKEAVILHFTGGSAESALSSAKGKTGYHTLIKKDGTIVEIADGKEVTYHAGKGRLKDFESINSVSFGIEVEALWDNVNNDYEELTSKQLEALLEYLPKKTEELGLTLEDIFGHNEITALADQKASYTTTQYQNNEVDYMDTSEVLRLRNENPGFLRGRKADWSSKRIKALLDLMKSNDN